MVLSSSRKSPAARFPSTRPVPGRYHIARPTVVGRRDSELGFALAVASDGSLEFAFVTALAFIAFAGFVRAVADKEGFEMADGDLQKAGDVEEAKPVIDELNGLARNTYENFQTLTNDAEAYANVINDPEKIQGANDRAYADARLDRLANALVEHLNGLAGPTRAVFDSLMSKIGYTKDV